MENASKALLMAAGVLIGILIISLAVYLFVSFGSTSAELHKQNEEQQIAQFNSQFTSYEGKECTIYDVITVANLATENNKYYEFPKRTSKTNGKDNYISVQINNINLSKYNGDWIESKGETNYDDIIKEDLKNMQEKKDEVLTIYSCTAHISLTTRRVDYVIFNARKE